MTLTDQAVREIPETKIRPELDGVPETLLWTLWNRACEARRPDSVLDDPMAQRLVDAIDYPFEERLGPPHPLFSQVQGLRSLVFDQAVQNYVATHPYATVVALGEGLETAFWRCDNGRLQWLSVELPEAAELRRRLLPEHPRHHIVSASVTDLGWLEEVRDRDKGCVVTAQGLFMYLRPAEVRSVLDACARELPGGALVLDSLPRWVTRATRQGKLTVGRLTIPPMHWSMAADERWKLTVGGQRFARVRGLTMPPGRGRLGWLIERQHKVPVFRSISPAVTEIRFR
ncbi:MULTISPECIES: class I SAM-dependent methyltransferase [unclassified Streptomyces]|uniref:class I SAM-dependent methyltransferase n=1 Tax=unclassified Streptomyces TaxID=2593676 RepID=UPI00278C885A|nr:MULTISPECIES: class I SAM-dependent methyltransferase [unclassified Streptomyces]